MCDYKNSCKEYDSEPCDAVTRQPPICFKLLKGKISSCSEKTCNLCNVKGACGIYRPLVIHLKNHSNELGKDYDEIFAALAYICDDFIPLPGGGEGTTEYIAQRHRDDDCVDDCPLCEKERERAAELTEELKGFDE